MDEQERNALIEQCMAAQTQADVDAAREALDAWIEKHPDDMSMLDLDSSMSRTLASRAADPDLLPSQS